MNRTFVVTLCLISGLPSGISTLSAAERIIKGFDQDGRLFWQPKSTRAVAGDEIEWQIGLGEHQLKITNWNDVKDHLEVVRDPDHQEFNETGERAGENTASTNIIDRVLLRSKIKSSFPLGGTIKFECIVHGGGPNGMEGTVTIGPVPPGPIALLERLDKNNLMMVHSNSGDFIVGQDIITKGLVAIPVDMAGVAGAGSANITTVKSFTGPLRWETNTEEVEIGKEIQWVNGVGPHGLRITNWKDVKNAVEVIEAHGTPESFKSTGETPPSSEVNKVYARLKVNSFPPTTDTIEYECVVHGNRMTGTVRIRPAAKSHSPRR